MAPPHQPLASLHAPVPPPFQPSISMSSSTPIGISSSPGVSQATDTQRSRTPNAPLPLERPSSLSPPVTTASESSHSPRMSSIPGSVLLPPPVSSIGFTRPAFSNAPTSLLFPHLSSAASLAAASSTAAFYSGLRNLQQFQQQHAAAAAAAALQASVSPAGTASSGLGFLSSSSDIKLNGASSISPPLLHTIPSLRLPTSSGFIPISISPKGIVDARASDTSCGSGVVGGTSPPRISPRSGSAFSVESNS